MCFIFTSRRLFEHMFVSVCLEEIRIEFHKKEGVLHDKCELSIMVKDP